LVSSLPKTTLPSPSSCLAFIDVLLALEAINYLIPHCVGGFKNEWPNTGSHSSSNYRNGLGFWD